MTLPRRGFTLLEVVISLTIIVVLISFGTTFSFTYLRHQQLRTAADVVMNELSRAQAESAAQSDDAAHGIAVFSDRVVRFVGASYATRDTSLDHETEFADAIDVSGLTEVVFPSASWNPETSGTITLESETLGIDIELSAYGMAELSQRAINP